VPQDAPATKAPVEESRSVTEDAPASASSAASNWAAPAESPWEMEAKKASMFASTWDAPATEPPPAAPSTVAEAEKFLAEETAENLREAAPEQSSSHGAAEFAEETKADAAESIVNGSAYSSSELLTGNEAQEIPVFTESSSSYASASLTEEAASPQA